MKKIIALACALWTAAPALALAQDAPAGAGGPAGDVVAQEDSRMPVWPWVVGGLAGAGAAAAAFAGGDGRHNNGGTTTTATSTGAPRG